MKTKHVLHVTLNGKNVRVEADTFEAVIEQLNVATKNQKFDMATLEHMVVLGE